MRKLQQKVIIARKKYENLGFIVGLNVCIYKRMTVSVKILRIQRKLWR
jgi:hypothetical protein